ncbi:ABC transporter ATP-binding protein [Patulibacter minatonensis]|uniref:ABC transporter ATP-binding protein n=1 Tax=Patulibacter minatonensis TaxID=298163 RepID=UPI0004BBFD0A|nr:ABC transporter ATP-binding protein [Patulibacter minatonensis]
MTTLLQLKDVRASYDGALVLDGVSLHVDAGETVGLVGRNGAGKTTTLLSIFGVPQVTGEILVEGKALGKRGYEPAARGVSIVPQEKRIFPNLTVTENILLGGASGRRGRWTVETLFELFPNLARGKDRPGDRLSGGEQQMLAIARGLMADPKVLLLDEPTEGLAPVIIDELIDALKVIQDSGTALVLVEQHVRMVQMLASRFVALGKGRVVAEGATADLQSREVQELIAL